MNTKTLETKVGIINLSEREIATEDIEVYFRIGNLSKEWQEIIAGKIEEQKEQWDKNFLAEHKVAWSEKGVNIIEKNLVLLIKDKMISYRVLVEFVDKKNEYLEDVAVVNLNLHGYEAELLQEVKNAVLEKFF